MPGWQRFVVCAIWCSLPAQLFGQSAGQSTAPALLTPADYAARRAALRARIDDGIVVLHGNGEPSGSEAFRVFHQDSNFLYLTGYNSPGAMLVLTSGNEERQGRERSSAPAIKETLYIPSRDPQSEVWTGPQLDPDKPETAAQLAFESVRSVKQLDADLRRMSKNVRKIFTTLPNPHAAEDESAFDRSRLERLKKVFSKASMQSIDKETTPLRQIKSALEIEMTRRAVACTMDAHRHAGRALQPGVREYEIAALMKYTMERAGCTITGFDPIVAAGPRSTILHYTRGDKRVEQGDLVVVDVGGEFADYSADISRTLPASGKFTARQREIYEIVLGAQEVVLKAVRPGASLYGRGADSLHNIAREYLNTHGQDRNGQPLGKYFTHGIGHQVGLDVHDSEDRATPLREGMILAIEPGLYLPDENIGVRIEDMVLVTKDGGVLLSTDLPRTVEDVERWLALE